MAWQRARAVACLGRWLLVVALVWMTPAAAVDVDLGAVRVQVGGFLESQAVVGTEGGVEQHPEGIATLRTDVRVTRAVRAHLELRGLVGGPSARGDAGVENWRHTFQDPSPSGAIPEVWGEWRTDRTELRLGVQRFAWGVLDGIPPTDVLNPRDLHDPFVVDFEEAKIGVPAAQLQAHAPDLPSLALRDLSATLVWIPLAVPVRLAPPDERWFPAAASPGDAISISRPKVKEITDLAAAHAVTVPLTVASANRRAPQRLDEGGIALRLAGTLRSVGWHLYHYSGPETGPNADLKLEATIQRAALSGTPPELDLQAAVRSTLRQARDTIHLTGLDLAWVLGDVSLRAEGAFVQDRPTLRLARDLASPAGLRHLELAPSLVKCLGRRLQGGKVCSGALSLGELFVDRDAVEWGIGADTIWRDTFVLAQLNQIVGTEPAPRLVIADPETRVTALVRHRVLHEQLELEVRAIYALERGGWIVFPRASYAVTDDVRLRVGYLAIGGTRNSLFGEFGRNDEVVFQLRYSF